jgi:putative ABC transport system substrate-binding protein
MDGVTFQLRWQHLCKNHILRIVLLLCLLCTTQLTHAKTLLLLSSKVSYYQEVAQSIQINASAQGIPNNDFHTLTVEQFKQQREPLNQYNLIVAIGTAAATEALNHESKVPLLNIFIPKNAYDSIHSSNNRITTRKVSAIYLDQPLKRLITLACLLKPKAKKFGTIFGPISRSAQPEIEMLAKAGGMELKYDFLSKEDNPVSTLKPVVTESELFIAIPDHAILNKAIARWILYLSFQHKIPVIGFSNAYTNAGAIASVYSSPDDIGKQAAEDIASWIKDGNNSIWNPVYPRYFTLSTNPAVARSLGISLPSDKELYIQFKQKEAMADDK